MERRLQSARLLILRYASWTAVVGIVPLGLGLGGIYFGILTPIEATPFVWLGNAGIIAAIVLFVLAAVAKRIDY